MLQSYSKHFEERGFNVYRLPFNPFGIPIMSLMISDEKRTRDCLKTIKQLQGYDVILGNFLNKPYIVLLSCDLIKDLCIKEGDWNYIKDRKFLEIGKLISEEGIFFDEGLKWKNKRKILNKVFNFQLISKMYPKMEQIARETFDEYASSSQKSQVEFCVSEIAQKIFSKVSLETSIGGNITGQKIKGRSPVKFLIELANYSIKIAFEPLVQILGANFVKSGIRKSDKTFCEQIKMFKDWATSFIKQRIEQETEKIKKDKQNIPSNIIGAVVYENMKRGEEEKQIYGLKELVGEFIIFFFAGTDSTTSTFNMMIYHIFTNPSVQAKLRQQILETVGQKAELTYENTKNMKYLEAVQKQTLRLSGPFNKNQIREVVKDHDLLEVPIITGTKIEFMSYTAHMDEKYYKDPKQFRPERCMNGQCESLHPFAYVPFNGGSRACIGKQLALSMSKIALIVLMKSFKSLEVLDKQLSVKIGPFFEGEHYKARMLRA